MTFLRMPEKVSLEEGLIFNYWSIILKLLDLGVPWEAIHNLQVDEIAVIIGVDAAYKQRQAEADAAAQRQAMR